MIQSLYDNFKHWSENGSVYLISDPHFNDPDTKIMNENWISPEEHVKRINGIVHKNDTLICLGDCGDLSYIQQLKAGYKVLIKGNHDDKGNSFYRQNVKTEVYNTDIYDRKELYQKLRKENKNCLISITQNAAKAGLCSENLNNVKMTNYLNSVNESYVLHQYNVTIHNNLFDEVYSGPLFIGEKILLSHEPVNGLPFCLNIHGHCHNYYHEYIDEAGGKHLNIAADIVNFKILELNDIIKSGSIAGLPTIHRIAIDKQIERCERDKNKN